MSLETLVERTNLQISEPSIPGVTISTIKEVATKYTRLEPNEMRVSRSVLRGLGGSNVTRLPGGMIYLSTYNHEACLISCLLVLLTLVGNQNIIAPGKV